MLHHNDYQIQIEDFILQVSLDAKCIKIVSHWLGKVLCKEKFWLRNIKWIY